MFYSFIFVLVINKMPSRTMNQLPTTGGNSNININKLNNRLLKIFQRLCNTKSKFNSFFMHRILFNTSVARGGYSLFPLIFSSNSTQILLNPSPVSLKFRGKKQLAKGEFQFSRKKFFMHRILFNIPNPIIRWGLLTFSSLQFHIHTTAKDNNFLEESACHFLRSPTSL